MVREDASVDDGGGSGKEAREVSGDGSILGGKEVISADKDEADAVSVLGYVGVCILFVKSDVVVHDGGSLVYVGNEVSVL